MAKNGGTQSKGRENEALQTPTDLGRKGVEEITAELLKLLADTFALYLKTKNFHWHMSGNHFRDYHLLLDDHGDQIYAMTDDIAERARKLGGTTLRSIGDISRHQTPEGQRRRSDGAAIYARRTLRRQPTPDR